MQKYTREQLEAQYKKLPDELKDALFSVDVASKIYGIGRRFGLTIEKTGFMAEETGYVVLGLTRPQDFTQFLAERLGIEMSEAKEIASVINQQVFFPLREALKTAHHIEMGEKEIQAGAVEIKKAPPAPLPPKPTMAQPPPPARSSLSPVLAPAAERPQKESAKIAEDRPTSPPAPTPPQQPKPLEEKTSAPAPLLPPHPPEVKPPAPQPPTSPPQPAPPKIPPIDLRPQTKPKPSGLLPKPEAMGKGIFGAPPMINSVPKPPLAPAGKPAPPQPPQTQPRSFDPYREQVE